MEESWLDWITDASCDSRGTACDSSRYHSLSGNDVTLLDWQTGRILWRLAADATDGRPAYAMAQPNGPAMAIAFGGQPRTGDVDQLWIVAADGQATQVVSRVFYPVFGAGF